MHEIWREMKDLKLKNKNKCAWRESNPGQYRGSVLWYHYTSCKFRSFWLSFYLSTATDLHSIVAFPFCFIKINIIWKMLKQFFFLYIYTLKFSVKYLRCSTLYSLIKKKKLYWIKLYSKMTIICVLLVNAYMLEFNWKSNISHLKYCLKILSLQILLNKVYKLM